MILDRLLLSLLPAVLLLVACGASSGPAPLTSPASSTPTAATGQGQEVVGRPETVAAAPPTVPLPTDPVAEPTATSAPSDREDGSNGEYESGGISPATAEPAQPAEVQHDIMPTRLHVSEATSVEYNSVPPTSGDHWPQWSRCGFFVEELPDERLVHNLEHGNIVVSYNLADENSVNELRAAMDEIDLSSNWGVIRAYKKIPEGTVALAAWGVSDTMVGIHQDRIRRFFDKYAGELAPERIPCHNSGVMPLTSSPPSVGDIATGTPTNGQAAVPHPSGPFIF